MFPQEREQDTNIFETAVKALAVKGNHGVGSIAKNHTPIFVMIRHDLEHEWRELGLKLVLM